MKKYGQIFMNGIIDENPTFRLVLGMCPTLAITLISSIRELFGAGTLFGVQVMPESYLPMGILVKPAGGFIVLGLTLALVNKLLPKKA